MLYQPSWGLRDYRILARPLILSTVRDVGYRGTLKVFLSCNGFLVMLFSINALLLWNSLGFEYAGGKLLLELNQGIDRSLTLFYKIDATMSALMKKMCWELVVIKNDTVNQVGLCYIRKPTSNECYEQRAKMNLLCKDSGDANATRNVPLEACMHKIPVDASEQGSQWPKQWSARAEKVPYWLKSSQVGVYNKAAPEDFAANYKHWKHVVSKSYLNRMGISLSKVRNVMDMRFVYGGLSVGDYTVVSPFLVSQAAFNALRLSDEWIFMSSSN
ncbi:hypothetical protein IFM89_032043 [Coptis chinensis]|uniref:Methyltransferase n=1 Tax=Coptis chinensis TaxID=261450 RepID=A0A835H158_9MAGN|nr:hypothetical protein IFM89_032043 [Coptis chinensis]